MKLTLLITYSYSFLILIPFFIEMLKMNKKLAKLLYLLITVLFVGLYVATTDFSQITLTEIITAGLSVAGGASLIYASIQFKESHTERRLEANIFLMLLATGFYIISNPAVIAPLFMALIFFANYTRFFPMATSSILNFKTSFFTTAYGIEVAKLRAQQETESETKEFTKLEVDNDATE